MSESVKTFPSDESEALAFLYIQNQDLSGLTPPQIYDEYRKAYKEIRNQKVSKPSKSAVIDSPM